MFSMMYMYPHFYQNAWVPYPFYKKWAGNWACCLVSFAGMTLNKCAIFRIGTLTESWPGCPMCRESHPCAVVLGIGRQFTIHYWKATCIMDKSSIIQVLYNKIYYREQTFSLWDCRLDFINRPYCSPKGSSDTRQHYIQHPLQVI